MFIIFSAKIGKIAQISDHNIDPWFSATKIRRQSFIFALGFWRAANCDVSCQIQNPQKREKFWLTRSTHGQATPGVDVMITIFCDLCQFSATKLAFSQKPM
jgi:hypothetical protein